MARDLAVQKVRAMTAEEIRVRIKSLEEELFNLRFRNAMRQLDNSVEIRNLRRDLARMKTVIREHETGIRSLEAEGAGPAV